MKPIIMDMNEMSDSTEVYESRPNPFFVYFIYGLLALLVVIMGWMYFSKLEIVVKSNGMFRSEEAAIDVSSSVNGAITECNISEGMYVNEGDLLFTINADSLESTIAVNNELLSDVEKRIEILRAYGKYLDGDNMALYAYVNNKYYSEFDSRKRLLELNTQTAGMDNDTKRTQYEKELENVNGLIEQYEGQIRQLKKVERCVKKRKNNFDNSETYYESIVSSYISNYNLTAGQYDTKIDDCDSQIDDVKKQIEKIEDGKESDTGLSKSDLEKQLSTLQSNATTISQEKEATLKNLELQQIATIEQQIENINLSLSSAKSNKSTIQNQLDTINNSGVDNADEINLLNEKQRVASELVNYEAKKTEYENTLKQYDLESGHAKVTATASGYISMNQDIKQGSYITQGAMVCQILPENKSGYYAEIYVENADIAKLKVGQEVKFEIAAYPSSEYGYFTGKVESISKDIKVDNASGSAYYLVKVKCEQTTVTNKDGKTGSILNGMACQAKVVVDEENVLEYLLKKIDILD